MNYKARMVSLIGIDSAIVLFSIFIAHFLLIGLEIFAFSNYLIVSALTLLVTYHIASKVFGLYRKAWRYASMEELVGVFLVTSTSIVVTAIVQKILFNDIYSRGLIVTFMVHMLLLGGVRYWSRFVSTFVFSLKAKGQKPKKVKRTLIIGVGSTGRMLLGQLKEHPANGLQPVAFIDDDYKLQNLIIGGLPVAGTIEELSKVVRQYNIEHIVIAIPSLTRSRLNEIVKESRKFVEHVQILPMITDLAAGKVSINEIRDVVIEDLLGREPVQLDVQSIAKKIEHETVLITGAGGSIGSELSRQLATFNPSQIILLGHGENSIYTIDMELRSKYKNQITIFTEIADVQDREKMFLILKKYRPSFVFHAAAHKHVPLMEKNPEEAVKNNILGTKNVAEASDEAGVDTFVMISTDKAVNPTSVMGASKRIAEMIVQNLDKQSETRFVAVRFGNVLGSRGSVVPLFKKQIAHGGPLTVTHPDMTRYFMTIPEAARLVIQAGALARGGEIFVLDMGEPVKIVDLAKNLISLSGFTEDEIKIEFTGSRPGEKLYEEILNEDEVHNEQVYPKIYIGKAVQQDPDTILQEVLDHINDKEILRDKLLKYANHKMRKNENSTSKKSEKKVVYIS